MSENNVESERQEPQITDLDRLNQAVALRNFEIELFWKRFNYFWLISAAALVGYVSAKERTDAILLLISCFGLVSAVAWTLLNIGSKWWQEAYEERVKKYERVLEDGFFTKHAVPSKRLFIFRLRRFSVTAIAVAISAFSAALWFGLATWHFCRVSRVVADWKIIPSYRFVIAYGGTVLFCMLLALCAYRGNPR
jgi:hypothetical protein